MRERPLMAASALHKNSLERTKRPRRQFLEASLKIRHQV